MKPSILLAAAAFLAVSTDYAIAATLPKPTGKCLISVRVGIVLVC